MSELLTRMRSRRPQTAEAVGHSKGRKAHISEMSVRMTWRFFLDARQGVFFLDARRGISARPGAAGVREKGGRLPS